MTPPLTHTTPPYRACLAGTFVASKYAYLYCYKLFSNKRIVGISTVSRREHHTAQTRELAATKLVLPQVLYRGDDYLAFTQ